MKSRKRSKYQFMAVDMQYDFTRRSGKHWRVRLSVPFVRLEVIPTLQKSKMRILEVISDYRQPRPGDTDESCVPGTPGFQSEIPSTLINERWIKSMNSPLFTRDGAGDPKRTPGPPTPDVLGFWQAVDRCYYPKDIIVLFGLTLDCCLLCTAQALRMFGYDVRVLREGTDTYSGEEQAKLHVQSLVVDNWAHSISWAEIKKSDLGS